jgi:hypothetical protein
MSLRNLLENHWALIGGALTLLVTALGAAYKIGAQGKATLKETHAAQIDLLRDRVALANEKAESFLRQKDELERKIVANASKEELTIAVQKLDGAATEWATATAAVGSTLTAVGLTPSPPELGRPPISSVQKSG